MGFLRGSGISSFFPSCCFVYFLLDVLLLFLQSKIKGNHLVGLFEGKCRRLSNDLDRGEGEVVRSSFVFEDFGGELDQT